MRDFFIRGMEVLVNIVMVILMIALVAISAGLAFNAVPIEQGMAGSPLGMVRGPVAGLLVLVGGGIYLIFVGGFIYLGLGIYQNTRRTAEALERMAAQ